MVRAACSWWGRPAPARRCWPARSRARRTCRSSGIGGRLSSSCSSASARPASVTCSSRRARRGARHHLHRRGRRDRPAAQREARRGGLQRRAGADARPSSWRRWTGSSHAAGIVVLAATNRPTILDRGPAPAGPVRPAGHHPAAERRRPAAILAVACRDKQLAPRREPGPIAAAPPVSPAPTWPTWPTRRLSSRPANREVIAPTNFDEARDRIILGRRKGSNVLLPKGARDGVRVRARAGRRADQHADPVAKVTILPAAQTLGVTEQLPLVERHMYYRGLPADSLAVRLGGRPPSWWWSARAPPARPTTWPERPTWPPRWSGSSACPRRSARSGTPRAARCSSAAAAPACPAARSPRPPRRRSTRRSPACCARPRSGPSRC